MGADVPSLNATTCEIKKGFFSTFLGCKGQPVGLCIYCGRAFCAAHGEVQSGGQEICSRKNCLAKRDDLVIHLHYVAVVQGFNESGACGQPGCHERPDGQCGRCRAYYCGRHLDTREETVSQGRGRISQMASMCPHCWQRRPIWTRM